MGTITPRKRQDGIIGYTEQIRLKRGGKIIRTEAQTFDRKPAAAAWLKKREGELAQPGALDRLAADDPPLADVIDRLAIGADLWVRRMRNVEADAAQLRSALIDQDDFVLPLQKKSG